MFCVTPSNSQLWLDVRCAVADIASRRPPSPRDAHADKSSWRSIASVCGGAIPNNDFKFVLHRCPCSQSWGLPSLSPVTTKSRTPSNHTYPRYERNRPPRTLLPSPLLRPPPRAAPNNPGAPPTWPTHRGGPPPISPFPNHPHAAAPRATRHTPAAATTAPRTRRSKSSRRSQLSPARRRLPLPPLRLNRHGNSRRSSSSSSSLGAGRRRERRELRRRLRQWPRRRLQLLSRYVVWRSRGVLPVMVQ